MFLYLICCNHFVHAKVWILKIKEVVRLILLLSLFGFTSVQADDYYDQHFNGQLNYSYSSGGSDNFRENANIRFGWVDNFDDSVVTIGIEAYSFSSRIDYVFENEYLVYTDISRTTIVSEIRTENITYEGNNSRFDSAYIKLTGDWAELFIGREKVIWGQFDIFSPVNLLHPLDFSDTSVKYSKIDFTLPQTHIRISFFPSEEVELSLYYFPDVEIDEISLSIDDQSFYDDYELATRELTAFEVDGTGLLTATNSFDSLVPTGSFSSIRVPLQLKGLEQYAFRLVYRGDINFGFTYYDGYWGFNAQEYSFIREAIPVVEGFNHLSIDASRNTPLYQTQIERVGYNKVQAIGLELAVPTTDFDTFKIEYTHFLTDIQIGIIDLPRCANISSVAGLSTENTLGYAGCNDSVQRDSAERDARLLEFITQRNNNRLYITGQAALFSIGVDHISDDLNVFFGIFGSISFADELAETANTFGDFIDDPIIGPTLAVIQKYGTNLNHSLNFTLGSIGTASGISLGYRYKHEGGIEFLAGIEAVEFSNDSGVLQEIEDDALQDPQVAAVNVDENQAVTVSFRTGISVKF